MDSHRHGPMLEDALMPKCQLAQTFLPMKKKGKCIPKVASSSISQMTLEKNFILGSLVKFVFHRNVIHEFLFLKCDDQIVQRFLVANTNNCFEGNLHGQQARKYIFPIY